jgi:uncharacterized protein
MTPAGEPREYPFWTYEDLALFIDAVLPCFALSAILMRLAHLSSDAVKTLVFQLLVYAMLLGVLYLLISGRHGYPFWSSLRWTTPYRGSWICILAGPALAIGVAQLGAVLHAPVVPTPIEDLISDRRSLVIMMIFVTILGPLFEELLFRGFLFPLLARSLGPWLGIILTAAPFALLHGNQYQWSWQHVALIGLAGAAFGFARYKTGSTAASAIVHAGYNVTFFLGFLVQRVI